METLTHTHPSEGSTALAPSHAGSVLHPSRQRVTHAYSLTHLGRASVASSISPSEAEDMFFELKRALKGFRLDNDIPITYFLTPLSGLLEYARPRNCSKVKLALKVVQTVFKKQRLNIDEQDTVWEMLALPQYQSARTAHDRTGLLIIAMEQATTERFSIAKSKSIWGDQLDKGVSESSLGLRALRMQRALALWELTRDAPLEEISRIYSIDRAELQELTSHAGNFAGRVITFCKCLRWKALELIFTDYQPRLHFGVSPELVELMSIKNIHRAEARNLHRANVSTLSTLAVAAPRDIAAILMRGYMFQAKDGSAHMIAEKRARSIQLVAAARAILITRGVDIDTLGEDTSKQAPDTVSAAETPHIPGNAPIVRQRATPHQDTSANHTKAGTQLSLDADVIIDNQSASLPASLLSITQSLPMEENAEVNKEPVHRHIVTLPTGEATLTQPSSSDTVRPWPASILPTYHFSRAVRGEGLDQPAARYVTIQREARRWPVRPSKSRLPCFIVGSGGETEVFRMISELLTRLAPVDTGHYMAMLAIEPIWDGARLVAMVLCCSASFVFVLHGINPPEIQRYISALPPHTLVCYRLQQQLQKLWPAGCALCLQDPAATPHDFSRDWCCSSDWN
eukprot:gnl/Dysnectes_brevis/12172_a26755_108.p1 GENE.gnl/Dysnectes_brevis/12172_a26755_108~~gnl/Dysnectes_brevis/12172_a26755_108.p1  ORF type:complete len:627 (+),score=176.55 gnl/Dysnectes_brevis/12172_a26755_108:1-1881(+)